ncbi:MAG: nitrilase-related carbon-nitrogen hydrolase, partial [Nitrosopumilaceae archaeon]
MTKIALVQFKADVNKYKNLKKITEYISKAAKRGAKLCAFPEFM